MVDSTLQSNLEKLADAWKMTPAKIIDDLFTLLLYVSDEENGISNGFLVEDIIGVTGMMPYLYLLPDPGQVKDSEELEILRVYRRVLGRVMFWNDGDNMYRRGWYFRRKPSWLQGFYEQYHVLEGVSAIEHMKEELQQYELRYRHFKEPFIPHDSVEAMSTEELGYRYAISSLMCEYWRCRFEDNMNPSEFVFGGEREGGFTNPLSIFIGDYNHIASIYRAELVYRASTARSLKNTEQCRNWSKADRYLEQSYHAFFAEDFVASVLKSWAVPDFKLDNLEALPKRTIKNQPVKFMDVRTLCYVVLEFVAEFGSDESRFEYEDVQLIARKVREGFESGEPPLRIVESLRKYLANAKGQRIL